ncbi:helix-turn-helix domain-containing protein [Acetobacter sp. DmW_136]|uniref:YdaS family helix-turn-helix protein n=1 Tax=Acetobacter sp. DmW_136 TaxID=2591091 RepID=UPI00123A9157|nr:YdaS family helix-turn-helix protein [Acetobacter sp. DmW_136]KAA8387747.1 helix-turn-helix domain-containing protein [Acetobacter sp. DmW_136]
MCNDAINLAISRAGGVSRLADAVGVSPPSVIGWRRRKKIPDIRVRRVSEVTGIPLQKLRPDLYTDIPIHEAELA